MSSRSAPKRTCGVCGNPCSDYASRWTQEDGETYYCHDPHSTGTTCYQLAIFDGSGPMPDAVRLAMPDA